MRLSRRGLLRGGALVLGVQPAGVQKPLRLRVLDTAAHAAAPPPALAGSDLDDLVAFAEVLAVGRALDPGERDALAGTIEEHAARDPQYRELCRSTIGLLQRLGGRRFSNLEAAARAQLIERHRLHSPDAGPDDDTGPLAAAKRTVRMRARRALIADYYRSPAGWATVGYDVFPGRCGDLLRYTRPES